MGAGGSGACALQQPPSPVVAAVVVAVAQPREHRYRGVQ